MPKNTNKVRVALYMRVSTTDQVDGFGLDMQKEALLEHVTRNKYKGWHTNHKWFFVEQGSGADNSRKELNRMIKMSKNNEFDLVLVWKIDRISRSLTDLLQIFEVLNDSNVSFASLKEDIDFTGAIGKLIFQIFGALAEFERETIKMRTEEGKLASARQGNYIGGDTPYGYMKVPNKSSKGSKLKLVSKEAKVVKQIFNWFVYDKKTLTEIAKELNKMKTPKSKQATNRKKNTRWYDTTIRTILTNDIYRGVYIVNRFKIIKNKPRKYIERPREEWITSDVEATISHALFSAANERLLHGSKGMRGGGKEKYMLAGKLIDVETGKKFIGYNVKKKGKVYKNYRRKNFTDDNGVYYQTISIAARDLEDFVWEHIEKAIFKPKLFLKLHNQNSSRLKNQKALEAEYTSYENALSHDNKIIDNVKIDYYEENIPKEERDELLAKYSKSREHNFKKLQEVEKQLKSITQYDAACKNLESFADNMKKGIKALTYNHKRDLAQMLVEKIEIHDEEDKRIAKAFFRFDQKAITSAIPMGRTDLQVERAKKGLKSKKVVGDSGFEPLASTTSMLRSNQLS